MPFLAQEPPIFGCPAHVTHLTLGIPLTQDAKWPFIEDLLVYFECRLSPPKIHLTYRVYYVAQFLSMGTPFYLTTSAIWGIMNLQGVGFV